LYRINNEKINLFKRYYLGYLYPLDKGVFMCFKKNGEYEGVKLMFLGSIEFYEHKADEMLPILEKRGLLVYED